MKKIFVLLLAPIFILMFSSCDDSGASETRAKIIAEDFVREQLIDADGADFDNGAAEKIAENSYHVTFDLKAKNSFGITVPKKVSVRLTYKGEGDWTSNENWVLKQISLLDESTGKIDVVYDSMYSFDDSKIMTEDTATNETESTETSDAPDNSSSNKFILGGIEFEIIESSIDGTTLRLYYKNKIRDIKKVKKIYADMKKKGITDVQFYNIPNAPRGKDYAAITGNLFLDHDNDKMINLDK